MAGDIYAHKAVEIFGVDGQWASQLNGLYVQLKQLRNGFFSYHNSETGAYLVRDGSAPLWKATMDPASESRGLISVCDEAIHPWEVSKTWSIIGQDGSDSASFKIKVVLRREEVKVGGREGFNCRLNGVFVEMPLDHCEYPAYHDADSATFLYRDPLKAAWVISNRLGKPLRNRPKAIYALCPDPDAARPYQAKCSWEVQAWGACRSILDPDITAKLREMASEPPEFVVVKSSKHPQCSGGFAICPGKSSGGMPVWRHEPELGRNMDDKWLFFDGLCWLIASDLGTARGNADAKSQAKSGKRLPDEACWPDAIVRTVKSASTFTFEPAVGKRWRDTAFPSGVGALGDVQQARGIDPAGLVWAQASDVVDGKICLFDSITADDCSSEHGAIWLSAACAAVAEFPGILDQVFVTQDVPEDGHYVLRLWDLNTRSWQHVEVNDMIPCFSRRPWEAHPVPAFAQSDSAELWTMIIEKAFAKLAGSYSALKGGHPGLALQALTGLPEVWTFERQDDGLWHKLLTEGAKGTPRDFTTVTHTEVTGTPRDFSTAITGPLTDLEMATALVTFDEKNYLMACTIPGDKTGHQRLVRTDGLVSACAYSLTTAKMFPQAILVKLRNPLGRFVSAEWDGMWSNSDATSWVNNPEVAEACFGPEWLTELKDPSHPEQYPSPFWMGFSDFGDRFTQIFVGPMTMASDT